jgi:hypothetical protein
MTNLTDNEKTLVQYATCASEFNNDELDFSKSWGEQHLENEDYFYDIVDIRDYAKHLKLTINQAKGVLGSLAKKDLVVLTEDTDGDDRPMTWLRVYEDNFNKIREALYN